jgi:tetratricopeptide (TPR) repeat protein
VSDQQAEVVERIGKAETAKVAQDVRAGNYGSANSELTRIIKTYGKDADALYLRAVCRNKLGKTEEAVADLKLAIDKGHGEANTLHEKINPLRKRIVGTITRCCDGTSSSATGRGACSHHRGVCDWNEPIYETSRKY